MSPGPYVFLAWIYVAISAVAGIAGCVYLVVQGFPWWGALVLLVGCGQSLTIKIDDDDKAKRER